METGLTADDVRLLSAWATSASDGGGSSSASEATTTESPGTDRGASAADDLQLLFGVIDDDVGELAAADAPRRTRKKRRATYLRTKEERESLQSEIATLESRLAVLKKRAGISGGSGIGVTSVNNALLRGVLHQQQLVMANVQSMMAKSVNVQELHPLYTPIHLGREWSTRRRTMESLKSVKLRNALQYLSERSRHHDELLPFAAQEVAQDAEGNVVYTQFDIIQFPGVRSLDEVFAATHYFFDNEEMVLSDRLGHLAIRDDYDVVDGVALNSRMYWVDENDIMTEYNAVCFARLFDGDAALDGNQCGILVTDNVDTDALYPYQSSSRVRKDLSGAISLTVAKPSAGGATAGDGDGLVVVMRRAAVVKLHRPQFDISPRAKETLIKTVSGWSQAMTDTIRARLSLPASGDSVLPILAPC